MDRRPAGVQEALKGQRRRRPALKDHRLQIGREQDEPAKLAMLRVSRRRCPRPDGAADASLASWNGTKSGARRACSIAIFRSAMGTRSADGDSSRMRPEGSIVVMLQRPARRGGEDPALWQREGPWLLTARDDLSQCHVKPSTLMKAMMPGREGLFYARRVAEGWEVLGPLPAND